jgi:hypothetical protein
MYVYLPGGDLRPETTKELAMMNDTVMVALAAEHRADLLREAEEQRRVAPPRRGRGTAVRRLSDGLAELAARLRPQKASLPTAACCA